MIDLYTWTTPNGRKVSVMLEESGLPYHVIPIDLAAGEQAAPDFVERNPNQKIPVLVDYDVDDEPITIFESGAILVYLAEKFGAFLPKDPSDRAECLSWLFWQMGSAPFLGGGFGHFYAYAPTKMQYPIDRYAMEVKRQLDVLNRNLADRRFLGGDEYTIADMATYPWYGAVVLHNIYEAAEFLDVATYTNVIRWAKEIEQRPAVQRGRRVNRPWGPEAERVVERHSARDFDPK